MNHLVLLLVLSTSCAAGENLLPNGGFELPDPKDPAHPLGWGRIDGLGVQWLVPPPQADGTPTGRALRFDTAVSERDQVARWKTLGISEWDIPEPGPGPVGATYGLSLYSDPVPILAATPYLVAVRHRGPGGGKIWVRGYARNGDLAKRVYEAQAELPASVDWREVAYAFHPTRHTPQVTEMRVMLYAYWPAGESWFEDVRLRTATTEELAAEDARGRSKPGK